MKFWVPEEKFSPWLRDKEGRDVERFCPRVLRVSWAGAGSWLLMPSIIQWVGSWKIARRVSALEHAVLLYLFTLEKGERKKLTCFCHTFL